MRSLTPAWFLCLLVSSLPAHATPLGEFADHVDVGAPKISGSAHFDEAAQEYLLTAGGANLWGQHDEFHFAYRKVSGDFILRARVQFAGEGGNPHRKLGWKVRSSLEPDAVYVDVAAHGDGTVSLQYRPERGGTTRQFVLPVSQADVLQLERQGRRFIISAARFGDPFVSADIADLPLEDDVLAGLFLCAHDPDAQVQAAFRDVRMIKPVKRGFTPYRDYIGSVLEILDVKTGHLERLYQSAEPFEAPNWTHDGSELIYNVSGNGPNKGVLRRFDLATRKPVSLETGVAVHNNNDHVLSFDGTMLGVSNQGPETAGKSAVFVLPATGGAARQVTPLAPSYFHGWSPDGKWLVYTGGRPDAAGKTVYSIYKIPVTGGAEVRLTGGDWLDDGPEFSPDGATIYFNSTRSGRMQLWRMKPDGTAQEQVTGDGYNNWFPHFSPDGKWIVFVSYGSDVAPSDHPYYRHVYLRLMPADGMAAPKIIAYVYGGQGTLNVPSWSPDGQRIAFVSNSDIPDAPK